LPGSRPTPLSSFTVLLVRYRSKVAGMPIFACFWPKWPLRLQSHFSLFCHLTVTQFILFQIVLRTLEIFCPNCTYSPHDHPSLSAIEKRTLMFPSFPRPAIGSLKLFVTGPHALFKQKHNRLHCS